MKRWWCLVLAGVLVLACTACNSESASSANAGEDVSATTATTANNTNGTSMTDDEAIKLCADKIAMVYKLRYWHEAAEPSSLDCIPAGTVVSDLTGSEYIIPNEYYPFSVPFDNTEINTVHKLKNVIESVYTTKAAHDYYYTHPAWVEYDNKLYRTGADSVRNAIWKESTIRIKEKGASFISFFIDSFDETVTYEYTLRYIDNNWKFDRFILDIEGAS